MAFNQVDVMGRPAGGGISTAHGPHLAFTVRGQQVAAHVIGKADSRD